MDCASSNCTVVAASQDGGAELATRGILLSDPPAGWFKPVDQWSGSHDSRIGLALSCVFVTQIAVALAVPVLAEEAYHWNYARHLDFGYYDHPPMVAWAIALGRLVFGDTRLGIRFIPLLFSLGATWLVAKLAQRIYGASAGRWAVFLYALQPAAFLVGGWGFPDAPLLFFWALTLTLVWQALETAKSWCWMAAGAALGGGMLSKYTTAFLVPSVLSYLLCSKRDRRWLATPWPYVAGVCSLIVFAPVIYWNWAHDWVSLKFQGTARFQAANGISIGDGLGSIAEQWFFILPLTLPLAIGVIRRLASSARLADHFLFWSFAPTAVFFSLMGFTPSFHLLWPLPAYLGLTVAMAGSLVSPAQGMARFYQARWRWLAGIAATFALAVGLHAQGLLPGLPPLREMHGWAEAAQRCRTLRSTLPEGSFYLTAGGRPYVPPGQLAFQLEEPFQVYGQNLIGREALQYRFWADPRQLEGKDAVVVVHGGDPEGAAATVLRSFFQTVEPAGDLTIPLGHMALGSRTTERFTFYVAHGYRLASTAGQK